MKKNRIAIKPESSLEAIICLAPVISAIRQEYPDTEVGVLAEECFREAATLLPNLDFFLSEATIEDFSMIYDFSNYAEEAEGVEAPEWKAYLQGCAPLAVTNPYHKIDLFRKAANLDHRDVNFELLPATVNAEELPDSLQPGERVRIALCAASLTIDQMQAALEAISGLSVPASVHLLGTVVEKKKSALLQSAWDGRLQLVDLCGRQSLSLAAETLRQCDICIAAPGSSALLSAGYGTFTICVDESRNPLHYPYGHGHLLLQNSDSEGFSRALSGLLLEIISFALNGNQGNIPSLDQWQTFADGCIENYLSRIRFFATQRIESRLRDGTSFTELYMRPLLFMGAEMGDVYQSFYRLLWEHSLLERSVRTNDLEILHQDSSAQLASSLAPLEQLYELANFGQLYSRYTHDSLRVGDIAKAKLDSAKLQETEELLFTLGKNYAFLTPLCAFHEKRQQLLRADTPLELAKQMSGLFEEMKERIFVLLDLHRTLFHTTLQNASPKAEETSEEGRY